MLGETTLTDLFSLDPDITHLNSAGFGLCPKIVTEAKYRYIHQMETSPDRFYRWELPEMLENSLQLVSQRFHANVESLTFMDNLTFVSSSVFESWELTEQDAVLVTNLTYDILTWKLNELAKHKGFSVLQVDIPIPLESEEHLIQQYEKMLNENSNIKYAVIDHITSRGSILIPVRELTRRLHEHNVKVFVDGAHATGQILHLNISEINAEYYTGNLHKWFFAPKSLALLHVRDSKDRDRLKPLIVSWLYHEDCLSTRFSFLGTRDLTNACVIPTILKFYEQIGEHETMDNYLKNLKRQGIEYLQKEMDIQPVPVPATCTAPYQVTLLLPHSFQERATKMKELSTPVGLSSKLWTALICKYKVNVCCFTMCVHQEVQWCIRISLQIHNTMQDFHKLVDALRQFAIDLANNGVDF